MIWNENNKYIYLDIPDHMLEALSDGCNECDTIQKHYGHVLDEMFKNESYKTAVEEFKAKYDPTGKLLQKFEEKIKEY